MVRGNSRFDKVSHLTERQRKRFKVMYCDAETYSMKDVHASFGIGDNACIELAKEMGLPLRKPKGVK